MTSQSGCENTHILLRLNPILDPQTEAEAPTAAAKVFIVQKWTREKLKTENHSTG